MIARRRDGGCHHREQGHVRANAGAARAGILRSGKLEKRLPAGLATDAGRDIDVQQNAQQHGPVAIHE